MIIFLSGPITANGTASRLTVWRNRMRLRYYARRLRHRLPRPVVLNPAILPLGMAYSDYMTICRAMIDRCDAVVLAPGWEQSAGSRQEATYAANTGRGVVQWKDVER